MPKLIKCKNCGNNLSYDPDSSCLLCEHCGSKTPFNQVEFGGKKPLDTTVSNKLSGVRVCPSCGAKDTFEENNVSIKCAYCGTPLVMESFKNNIDAIIPFSISKKGAMGCYKNWLRNRIWAPKSLKKLAKADAFEGFYLPAWAYDADVDTSYSGTLVETVETRTVDSDGNRVVKTHEKRTRINGNRSDMFVNTIVTGNNRLSNSVLQDLEPFDYSCLRVYRDEYIFGLRVDNFTYNATEGYNMAQNEMKSTIRERIYSQYRRAKEHLENLSMSSSYQNVKQARYLLPMWTASYTFKNKKYSVNVNGSTGEVKGTAPVSKLKVFLATLLGLAVVGLIVWFAIKKA